MGISIVASMRGSILINVLASSLHEGFVLFKLASH